MRPNETHLCYFIGHRNREQVTLVDPEVVPSGENGAHHLKRPRFNIAASAANGEWRDRLAPAVAAMNLQFSEPHTLSSLGALVGMSRSAFAGAFRASFGRAPMEFLASIRLNEAARLLRSTTLPLKAIGVQTGYTSRSSFTHAFHRAFGVAPGRFRGAEFSGSDGNIHVVAERLRGLSQIRQEILWEVDVFTGKVWWSDGTFLALGYDGRRPLVSDVKHFHERIHPGERQRVVEGMQAACVAGDLVWRDHFRFRKADGNYATIDNACIILRNTAGAPTRLIGVMQPHGSNQKDQPLLAASRSPVG
jgi:AraC-like DNA-binding protein